MGVMTHADISSKKCIHCGHVKVRLDFYSHPQMAGGFDSKCKECAKKAVAIRRLSKIEDVRAYDRERSKHPARIAASAEHSKRWRAEDRRRARAHSAVARAIRSGEIEKSPCCVCGSEKSMAHHESYDRPLDVVWYCQPHHSARHKQMAIDGIEP